MYKRFYLAAVCVIIPVFSFAIDTYYEGNGGAGIVIATSVPEGVGLADGDEWILNFIQELLNRDFARFSAIALSDRQMIESAVAAGMDSPNVGNFANAAYIMTGKLTLTAQHSYILELVLSDTSKGIRVASALKPNIAGDIKKLLAAINEEFADVLSQLDVVLTAAGREELQNMDLLNPAVQGAISIARGNAAEKNGNPIEMLSYLYNAVSYDPTLTSATMRIDSLTAQLASGDAGSFVKQDKAARDNWKKVLDEFESFYRDHPPFEVSYVPTPNKKGRTDYDAGTAVLAFDLTFQEGVGFDSMQKVLHTVLEGLNQTGNREVWGFANWPYNSSLFNRVRNFRMVAELVNNRNEVVDTLETLVSARLYLSRNRIYADATRKVSISFKPININNEMTGNEIVRIIRIDGIETEQAQQSGFVKVTPVEKLPKNKARSLLVLLTRDIFSLH
jgi:hypothetical protein